MSVFRNIRIYPSHGSRSATITWDVADSVDPGEVYVAFSSSGIKGSWVVRNDDAPVASAVGMFQDTDFVVDSGHTDGYYRLLLVNGDGDNFSLPIQIMGDITPKEYGMARAIIHREFTMMRTANGYPVWHCIPRDQGELADTTDPDTGRQMGIECDESESYGLKYKGGYYDPILTWLRPVSVKRVKLDSDDETSPREVDVTSVRLMAFPAPKRNHMIVDPASGRRYVISDAVTPSLLRGVIPVAYDAEMHFLPQRDPRYKFPVPELDTKAYRKIPYWSPAA